MICVYEEKEDNVEGILNVEGNEHEDNDHHWKCLKRTKKEFNPCRLSFFYDIPNASIMPDNVDELVGYFFCSSIHVISHTLTFLFNVILASTPRDPLEVPLGPITRLRVKRFNEAINGLLQDTWAKMNFERISKNEEQTLINLIHIQKWLVGELPNITKRLE